MNINYNTAVLVTASTLLMACGAEENYNSATPFVIPLLKNLPVCGHVVGQPLDTSPDGGINNTSQDNASGTCLKIAEANYSGQTHWFTGTPSVAVMEFLRFGQDDPYNDTRSYADTFIEDGTNGPLGKEFARFRQDGKGTAQHERYCQYLGEINFAGVGDWHRPTKEELNNLYNTFGNMWENLGWPTGSYYWSMDLLSGEAYSRVNLASGVDYFAAIRNDPNYGLCVSDR
ncbi:DUF823 domain-containing adhesin [Vibrio alginolyticus]|uniref:adhesion domain-containing protein n=1 Tax=Vibrio alginolyticus TaxID=663 RepID=UPI00215C8F73|nr:DUF823 domain-containing adhesin [Vibrio alginolyticus]MCR9571769.1 DUF823 domain-containing adhesin [Vibrio alginolyticus]